MATMNSDAKNLHDKINNLQFVFKQKQLVFLNSLNAPAMDLVGGGQLGGSTQQIGGSSMEYVSSDTPSKEVYATARLLLNVLKQHENTVVNLLGNAKASQLQNKIVDIHNQEKQLFSKVFQIGQIQNELKSGMADDQAANLYREARECNNNLESNRSDVLNTVLDSIRL